TRNRKILITKKACLLPFFCNQDFLCFSFAHARREASRKEEIGEKLSIFISTIGNIISVGSGSSDILIEE
ncbi:hypothetical protein, partial [Paenibacillus sp. N3.4]|uniref:hypothetical protein n=1 Tax=Paenibacillus sp. N3.4 TaxID=2603222 RepID=UPI001C9BFC86